MKLDTQTSDYDLNNAGANAVRFEDMGFDAVWSFEAAHDPFMALGVAAISTTRLEIGTNISVAFGRSPFAMAQVAWDLQHCSGGRFHLGLGTQVRAHVERRFSMPFDPWRSSRTMRSETPTWLSRSARRAADGILFVASAISLSS